MKWSPLELGDLWTQEMPRPSPHSFSALPLLTLSDPGHERGGVSRGHAFHHHTLSRHHGGILRSCHNDHVLPPDRCQGPWREGRPAGSLTIRPVRNLHMSSSPGAPGEAGGAGAARVPPDRWGKQPCSSPELGLGPFSLGARRAITWFPTRHPILPCTLNPTSRTVRVMSRLGVNSHSS